MRIKTLFIILILISLALLSATPALAQEVTAESVTDQLICQCNCGKVLSECTCATAAGMVALAEQNLGESKSEEEILDYFVSLYGEQVLASPPKRGFNLVAWILPFVAILAGGVVIYLVTRVWVKRGEQSLTSAGAEEGDEKYQRQLEKELKEFTNEGFR